MGLAVFVCEVAAMEVSQKTSCRSSCCQRASTYSGQWKVHIFQSRSTQAICTAQAAQIWKGSFSLKKRPNNYPVKTLRKKSKVVKRVGAPKVRQSLTPGTVLILLAGVHRGKRVVLLKSLKSGLLLVTGPYKINRVPVRRVHQHYVIATSTKLAVDKVEVTASIDDACFRRIREKRLKKAEGDIFAQKKKGYKPSAQRKADQIVVDKQVL